MHRKTFSTWGAWTSRNGAARVLLERICPYQRILVSNLSSSQKSQGGGKRAQNEMKNELSHKIGFIGSGNMAKAIAFSILDAGISSPKQLIASGTASQQFENWKERGVATTLDNAEVVDFADIVFIAAPPQHFTDVVSSLSKSKLSVDYQKCFVSTMGGKPIKIIGEGLSSVVGLKVPPQIIRICPNMPSMIGAGCCIMACDEAGKYTKAVQKIIRASGTCEVVPERLMNACAATCGCGPAYLYLVIESLADGAVRAGVSRDLAYKLAAQTVVGAGQMVLKTGKHPGVLKDEICSEGGSTIAGVHALEEGGVRRSFINAVVAATKRAGELGSGK
ncbi:hypothetical protein GE061_011236 [Apolygus lucorum]|uniref:Pyrroline-5-carboxylate reductase n=1 Tax=Apolygus lucorum TaxID=248454 RepID=A0A6A4K543_APOLU|nr:hypothetical protein GE061_011236 [Apolygus lucorum]